jgi:GNAT superfamily N-acetyltransferase
VVGLAAVAPATDEDLDDARWAELGPLLVLPGARGTGHGSRLLAAAVDLLVEDGFRYAVGWVFEADTVSRRFLEAAGWAVDGATRVLDLGGERMREIRLHTALAD